MVPSGGRSSGTGPLLSAAPAPMTHDRELAIHGKPGHDLPSAARSLPITGAAHDIHLPPGLELHQILFAAA